MPTGTIPVEQLKSPTDPNLPFYSFKLAFTTAVVIKDIYNEFGAYAKAVIITNNDSAAGVSVIQNDPSNPAEVIPPATKGESDAWCNFISLTPNAVTGKGLLELWLVKLEDAKKGVPVTPVTPMQMVERQML